MELSHWHNVGKLGGDKLHRPPVVALKHRVLNGIIIHEENVNNYKNYQKHAQNKEYAT